MGEEWVGLGKMFLFGGKGEECWGKNWFLIFTTVVFLTAIHSKMSTSVAPILQSQEVASARAESVSKYLHLFPLFTFYLSCLISRNGFIAAHCLWLKENIVHNNAALEQGRMKLHRGRVHPQKVQLTLFCLLWNNWFDLAIHLGSVGLLIRLCNYIAHRADI